MSQTHISSQKHKKEAKKEICSRTKQQQKKKEESRFPKKKEVKHENKDNKLEDQHNAHSIYARELLGQEYHRSLNLISHGTTKMMMVC